MPLPSSEITWNDNHVADFRANKGRITKGPLAGANVLLLTTTGAKTAEPRLSPLGFTRDGERFVVVGSNSGYAHHPAWLANIRANPYVTVEVGDDKFRALATITGDQERRRLWDAHIAAIPAFGQYEEMTDREIPVVTLERI